MGNNSVNTNSNLFFLARPSTGISNVTGDGTAYTVIFDTLANGSGYNTSTGIFTANNSGYHLFVSLIQVTNLSSSNNDCIINIVTTSQTYQVFRGNIGALRTPSNLTTINVQILAYLAAGDTAYTSVQVYNGTKVVGIGGNNLMGRCLT